MAIPPIRFRPVSPAGVVATLSMLLFILCCGTWWVRQAPMGNGSSAETIRKNELRAYANLKRIQRAQAQYHYRSAGIFGVTQYAAFVTHLWIAVDPAGAPVKLDLIPEALAVAVGATKSIDGYYFVDVRQRVRLPDREFRTIDYHRQWTVAALPAQAGRTGDRVFMTDQSGDVFAISVKQFRSIYPADPPDAGWIPIPNTARLVDIQADRASDGKNKS
jgi:hypothetical protein